MTSAKTFPRLGLAAWTLVILALCLVPAGTRTRSFQFCLFCAQEASVAGVVLNIGFYVPLGVALRMVTGSTVVALVGGFLLSIGVEVAQTFVPGRFGTLEDILANGAGAGIGGYLAQTFRSWFDPVGTRLAAAASALAVAAFLVPLALSTPTLPDGPVFVQWTPTSGGRSPYKGPVLSANIAETPVPNGPMPEGDRLRDAIGDSLDVDFTFQVADAPRRRRPVFRLVARVPNGWAEILQLGADRNGFFVRRRILADDIHLYRPEWRIDPALFGAVGDTAAVEIGTRGRDRMVVRVNGAERVLEEVPPSRAWAYLLSSRRWSPDALASMDAFFVAGLFVLLGWWAGTLATVAVLGAPPLLLLVGLPLVTPLSAAHWIVLLAALAAVSTGYLARRWLTSPGAILASDSRSPE